jgi:hypothetical protein
MLDTLSMLAISTLTGNVTLYAVVIVHSHHSYIVQYYIVQYHSTPCYSTYWQSYW